MTAPTVRAAAGAIPRGAKAASPNSSPTRVGSGRAASKAADPMFRSYRRIAHWLMKEPALEEETLSAAVDGETLTSHPPDDGRGRRRTRP